MRFAVFLALAAALSAAAPDGAAPDWIERLGGSVLVDGDGQVAVDLSGSWVGDADLARLAELGRIDRLDLSETSVADLGLEKLRGLEGVRELKLRFAEQISSAGVAHLRGWASLEALDLRGTAVRSTVFEHLAKLTALRRLDLSHTRITDEEFHRLDALESLEELSIGSNRLDGSCLPGLKLLPNLRRLSLAGVQRVDSGIWGLALNPANIARIAELTQLESLDLSGATSTDFGSDRPGSPIAERDALTGLESFENLKDLRELDLSRQPVTAADLAFVAKLPELRRLRLGQAARIDDAIVDVVRQSPRLESLYLAGTALTDAGLSRLAAVKSLREVNVGGTRVTAEAAESFRGQRPDCRVTWFEAAGMAEIRKAQ